ncbi:uncharacterized protein [Littorina saxatilis]|uniref:uncharacterized protein n=1 Tax=Littorina saxatilis TaxID=31220 RepID=UPI0038B46894
MLFGNDLKAACANIDTTARMGLGLSQSSGVKGQKFFSTKQPLCKKRLELEAKRCRKNLDTKRQNERERTLPCTGQNELPRQRTNRVATRPAVTPLPSLPKSLAAESAQQMAARQSGRNLDRSKVAYGSMVPPDVENADTRACSSSKGKAYHSSTTYARCASAPQDSATSGLLLIRKSLEARGVQGETFQVIWASWRPSTRQQYASYLSRWSKFCVQCQCDPLRPTIDEVLQFLTKLYEDGLAYSAINTARSALSAVVILPDNKTVGCHPLVIRFLKGIFELRTPQPRYNETWDVDKVLQFFRNLGENSELSLKDLTLKLCSLLLLITAHRVQTIHLIRLRNICFHDDGCTIYITEKLKQSTPDFHPKPLQLPFYTEDKPLCVSPITLTISPGTPQLNAPAAPPRQKL